MVSETIAKPKVGDKVDRDAVGYDGTVPGVVLAVVDDDHALGGWVAIVRWWKKHRARHDWEVCHAWDFAERSGFGPRVRVRAKRSR